VFNLTSKINGYLNFQVMFPVRRYLMNLGHETTLETRQKWP